MNKFNELVKKYNDLRQYEIYFPGEYSEQIAIDVGKIVDINVDAELITETFQNRKRKGGEESICLFRDSNDPRCFILVECNPGDWIQALIVRCSVDKSEGAKNTLLNWYKICREEESSMVQIDELEDCMFKVQNILLETLIRHNLLSNYQIIIKALQKLLFG